MTRTRKVRRKFVADKYAALIDALYSGAGHAGIEAEVTYEDGRKGIMKADLVIAEAATAAAPLKLAG